MGQLRKLFSLSGRTSRLGYWQIQLLCQLLFAVAYCAPLLVAVLTQVGLFGAAMFPLMTPVLAIALATMVRRLHDRNKSAWWVLVFYVGPYLLIIAGMLLVQRDGAELAAAGMILLALVLDVWAFVELGFFRGKPGPNRFGPDPYARTA